MRYLATIVLALCAFSMQAQLVVAEDCKLKEGIEANRLNDQQPIVIDGDTIPFALVRVGLAEPDAVFECKWLLKSEYKENENEYWLFFMEGVRSMTVKTKRFTPLHYKFSEPLKAKSTYTMTLHKPEGQKYQGTLIINSNVKTADIFIDGTKVSDGVPFTYVGEGGMHRVELKAPDYDPQTREVDIPMGQTKEITINLFAAGSLNVDGIGYGMVSVESATFDMGGDLNYYTRPLHKVSIMPIDAGSTFVSVDLWEAVMGPIADEAMRGRNGEIVNVSYDEVQDFISQLNEMTGKEFRLPTEAEWEYIAGNAAKLGVSDITTRLEWCSDWFGHYIVADNVNPRGPETGVQRVVRGGTEYNDIDDTYADRRYRWHKQPDAASPKISFRLVSEK